jgi:hypothetical protein
VFAPNGANGDAVNSDPTRGLPAPQLHGQGDLRSNSRFVNAPFGNWPEMICTENPHRYLPGKKAAISTADKPDF